ncbi:hypothetical protein K3495_g9446 [Podosphaera aphanis]|nr:hypothetical protein K3495_g9446 [Podosphaera aphanis]
MRPTLESLIADIQDEARRTDITESKSDTTRALHVGEKDKECHINRRCHTCDSRYRVTDDCLHNNLEKCRIWEGKTGKKWLSKDEYERTKSLSKSIDNQESVNKKVQIYHSSSKPKRVFPTIISKGNSSAYPGFLPKALTSNNPAVILKDRWLADSGADTMATNQKSDLIDYVDEPAEVEGAGGTTISPGFGTVKLNVILTNSTTRGIHLSKVRHIPQCPLKLFSLKKILSLGASLHFDKIMFVDDHKTIELCEVDKSGFLIESRHCYTNAYFNALKTAVDEASLDTWHRRLAHTGLRNVNLTKNIVEGINISPNSNSNPNLSQCDACELGAPIERKHKVVKNKVTDALARIHVDTFHLLPKGYNGHKYGMILTDEATSER